MKSLRYLAGVLGLTVLMLWGLTKAVSLYAGGDRVDAAEGQDTIFQTEAKLVVYNSPTVASMAGEPEVVILGASNTTLGLRPEDLAPLVGGVPVHNLSIGGQNVRTLGQLVDLIYRQTEPGKRRNIVFVIGAWYGLMIEDKRRWPTGFSDVDQELLRYSLFRKDGTGNRVSFRLPDACLSAGLRSVWPLMVPYAWYSELGRHALANNIPLGGLRRTIIEPWHASAQARNTSVMSREELEVHAQSYGAYVGPTSEWGDSGFRQLIEIARRIHAEGGKLVLIDMPLTTWAKKPAVFPLYQKRIKATADALALGQMGTYVDLKDALADDGFYDGIHPRPRATPEIARLAAGAVRQALAALDAQPGR